MGIEPSESKHLSLEAASTDPRFARIIDWIRTFLCAPNADVGRLGDVCPFARGAMSRNSIAFFQNLSTDAGALARDIERHLEAFQQEAGSQDIYRCRIIVPTDIDDADRAVELVQRQLKPGFVSRYFMLGQFFPGCPEPGLWNMNFRPLRAPVPLLAIRNMVPTDIAFLYDDDAYVRAYLQHFGKRGELALQHFISTSETAK